MNTNPFTINIVESPGDFCNREREIRELAQHARNGTNVVLFSPRRYGKSSLVTVVQKLLAREGMATVYTDLFPVTSKEDLVMRLASALFQGLGKGVDPRSFLSKAKNLFRRVRPNVSFSPDGFSISAEVDSQVKPPILLEELLEGLGNYVKKNKLRVSVVLDEFQEITELPDAKQIEGILRAQIQFHKNVSYFFVGSRRRILQDMFTMKSRPFYKSAFLYPIGKIGRDEFAAFLQGRFEQSGKKCPLKKALEAYDLAEGYPYYVQKLASILWDRTESEVTEEGVKESYRALLQSETPDFEAHWGGLSLVQRNLLKAIALSSDSPYSKDFLKRFNLSLGGVQKALKILIKKDLIEKTEEGVILTDPIMAAWLKA